MSVVIGTLSFQDAWIRNKWGGRRKEGLKPWLVNNAPAFQISMPSCQMVEQANRENVVYAIDGTPYSIRCGSFDEADNPQFNINAPPSGKVGDYIYITLTIGGGVVFYGIDNYGKEHKSTQNTTIAVRLTDEWNRYVLVYKACFRGQDYASGQISVQVLPNPRLESSEKEVVINTLNSTQAQQLGALLGQRVNISDGDITFTNALITEIEISYMAEDMPDIITRTTQNADIYTARVRFVA